MITISTAILDPDLTLFNRFCETLKESVKEELLTEFIVVDNASADKSYQDIAKHYFGSKAIFIVNEKNVGYGQAHNQAIAIAKGTYFVVTNDDVELYGPWAEAFKYVLLDPNIAQVGPINNVCNKWKGDGTAYGDENLLDPDYIEGSLFMMRTELARRYGPFDPIYQYGYYEDGDLSLRLKKDGYQLKQIKIEWLHHRAKTTNRILEETDVYGHQVLNKKIFEKRWYSYVLAKKFGKVIVVKREGSFGDVFLTTPIMKELRHLFPNDAIVLMSRQFEPVLVSDYVDAVTKMHIPIHADYFIDLDYAYERDFENIHIVKAYEREAKRQLEMEDFEVDGVRGHFRGLRLHMPELEKHFPKDFGQYIFVDVGTTWVAKKWPDEFIAEFIDRIRSEGYKVALCGVDPGPIPFSYDINFVNSLSIEQTVYALRGGALYVGQEGLLSHICQTLNKKHIVYYTCTKPEYTADVNLIGKSLFPVISPVVCQGCRHSGAVAGTTVNCVRNYICTRKVTVDMVYDKFKEVMNNDGLLSLAQKS